jgi:DNA-binding MarR family transcriptional regulator
MGRPKRLTPECEIANGCLAARLRLLNRLVTKLYDDALRPHGIRVSQLNILIVIAVGGPLRGVDVARRLRLDTSTLSRDLERLVKRGWVRSSPGVGRAQQLEVTAVGRELLARVLEDWRKAQRQARDLLSPAMTEALAGVVDSLLIGVDEIG